MENFDKSTSKKVIKNPFRGHLFLVSRIDLMPKFFKLLEQGFIVNAQMGCSIKELLCRRLGMSDDYLEERIQTIFLNGKPVDNVDTALVSNGSTIALSAAMPGLVGATLRKGGFLASMRSQISYNSSLSPAHQSEGQVILKLFNLVAKDLGPAFFQKGIWIKAKKLQEFIDRHAEYLKAKCTSIHLDDKKIDFEKLLEIDWKNKEVLQQVKTG